MARQEGEPQNGSRLRKFFRENPILMPVGGSLLGAIVLGASVGMATYLDDDRTEPTYNVSRISDHFIKIEPGGDFDQAVQLALSEIDKNCAIDDFEIGKSGVIVQVENTDQCIDNLR